MAKYLFASLSPSARFGVEGEWRRLAVCRPSRLSQQCQSWVAGMGERYVALDIAGDVELA